MKNRKLNKILLIIGIILFVLFIISLILKNWLQNYSINWNKNALKIPSINSKPSPLQEEEFDWPSWKGPNHNNASPYTKIKTDWSKGLKKIWEVKYLCQGKKSITWACPVIKGNRLVVTGRDQTNDHIYSLNPDTGDLIWRQFFPSSGGNSSFGEGPRSTPTIDEDHVYTLSRNGLLHCWNLLDGKLIWKSNLLNLGAIVPFWGFSTSPVIYKDKLLVQVGEKSLLIAFNKYNGKILWRSAPGASSYSTPVIMPVNNKDQIILLAGQFLSGFSPATGKQLWSTPWPLKNNINVTTPVPIPGKNIVIISTWYKKGIEAVDISGKNPIILWKNNLIEAHQTDIFHLNGYIYGYSGMSAHNKDDFKCLDLKTGSEMWSSNKLGSGQFIYVEPYFLSLDIKGKLYLIKPESKGYEIITSWDKAIPDVGNARAWTKPIIAQKKLYLRYVNRLICYDISG